MFRGNRPLRRVLRNTLGQPFTPLLRRQIYNANQLAQAGQYFQAAEAFSSLSVHALQNGHPRQAANLDAQAAHNYIDGKNEASAIIHARSALTSFQKLDMTRRAAQFLINIEHHLKEAGMTTALTSLQQEFSGRIPPLPVTPTSEPQSRKPIHLPPNCTGCGAPLRRDDVDWVDDQSAECPYCGSIILSE